MKKIVVSPSAQKGEDIRAEALQHRIASMSAIGHRHKRLSRGHEIHYRDDYCSRLVTPSGVFA